MADEEGHGGVALTKLRHWIKSVEGAAIPGVEENGQLALSGELHRLLVAFVCHDYLVVASQNLETDHVGFEGVVQLQILLDVLRTMRVDGHVEAQNVGELTADVTHLRVAELAPQSVVM